MSMGSVKNKSLLVVRHKALFDTRPCQSMGALEKIVNVNQWVQSMLVNGPKALLIDGSVKYEPCLAMGSEIQHSPKSQY